MSKSMINHIIPIPIAEPIRLPIIKSINHFKENNL